MSKKITTWYKAQSLTIKGAIISGIFAIIAAFITLLPNNVVTVVVVSPTSGALVPTPLELATVTALPTSIEGISINATPTDERASSYNNYRIIYPSCNCDLIVLPSENILIRVRWVGSTAEDAETGADSIRYVLFINGKEAGDISSYRKKAVFVDKPLLEGDPSNAWWVYWDIPAKNFTTDSIRSVAFKLEIITPVNNGWETIPAGLVTVFEARTHSVHPYP
jgi:hypothetical protein